MNLTVLALRMTGYRNGVSKLHGAVSRKLWSGVWPGVPVNEVPISHITNGIHTRTWHQPRHGRALRPLPGPATGTRSPPTGPSGRPWITSPTPSCGARTSAGASGWWPSPAGTSSEQLLKRGAGSAELAAAEEVLDPEALTIGFARRFATYKRANLHPGRPGAPGQDAQQPRPPRADHLRRQGPPARQPGQGPHPPDRAHRPGRSRSGSSWCSWKTTT